MARFPRNVFPLGEIASKPALRGRNRSRRVVERLFSTQNHTFRRDLASICPIVHTFRAIPTTKHAKHTIFRKREYVPSISCQSSGRSPWRKYRQHHLAPKRKTEDTKKMQRTYTEVKENRESGRSGTPFRATSSILGTRSVKHWRKDKRGKSPVRHSFGSQKTRSATFPGAKRESGRARKPSHL